jgi:hypothetical protein
VPSKPAWFLCCAGAKRISKVKVLGSCAVLVLSKGLVLGVNIIRIILTSGRVG